MLDKNLMQERPSDNDVLLMWQNIQFIPRDIKNNTLVQDFIADLRKLYVNGDALIYSFDISESSVFDWFLYNDRIDDISFANNFLKSKALKTIAPELKIDDTINPIIRPLYVNDIFDLDGVLARLVYNGGAYVRDIFSPIEAREKAQMITKELFQDRYTEVGLRYLMLGQSSSMILHGIIHTYSLTSDIGEFGFCAQQILIKPRPRQATPIAWLHKPSPSIQSHAKSVLAQPDKKCPPK